jgi:hypothetical protein
VVRLSEILIGALVSLIALVAISYIVEMLRPHRSGLKSWSGPRPSPSNTSTSAA